MPSKFPLHYETTAGVPSEEVEDLAALDALVSSGDVGEATLVWCEGMPGWASWDSQRHMFAVGAAAAEEGHAGGESVTDLLNLDLPRSSAQSLPAESTAESRSTFALMPAAAAAAGSGSWSSSRSSSRSSKLQTSQRELSSGLALPSSPVSDFNSPAGLQSVVASPTVRSEASSPLAVAREACGAQEWAALSAEDRRRRVAVELQAEPTMAGAARRASTDGGEGAGIGGGAGGGRAGDELGPAESQQRAGMDSTHSAIVGHVRDMKKLHPEQVIEHLAPTAPCTTHRASARALRRRSNSAGVCAAV